MGRLFVQWLESPSSRGVYACKTCADKGLTVHLALIDDTLSKSFHSRNGPAYLFSNAVNIAFGPAEEREMTTGRHLVCDTSCTCCEEVVGWYYVKAYERRERYKERMHILERSKVVSVPARHCLSPSTSASVSSGDLEAYEV